MNRYSVAFDVGGLFIKAAVLHSNGDVRDETVSIYPANSGDSLEPLLDHLIQLVRLQIGKIMDKSFVVDGIGYAFPGPFDYEHGVSYIRGVQKFDALYGVNLNQEFRRRIDESKDLANKFAPSYPIVFDNDANLFALGEYLSGKASGFTRCICLTVGTGTGSAFLEHGQLVKNRDDVPKDGWVYCDPFRDSIVDAYISKRGILRIAREFGMDPHLDVKDLAALARLGHANARTVFEQFGQAFAEVLNRYLVSFQPDVVVIGGQISNSHDLFEPSLLTSLTSSDVRIEFTADTSRSTFAGVARLLQQTGVQA